MPTNSRGWEVIIRHYEACLETHGATPAGVDWPNADDLAMRFAIMLDLLTEAGEQPELLDLGCGPGFILDYLAVTGGLGRIRYHGIDLSETMIETARARWPNYEFTCRNIVTDPLPDRSVDVVIMNGLLTERVSLAADDMRELAESIVAAAFRVARFGIAFNVMSAHVDWQRDDLFHWNFDAVAAFLKREVSPHYTFRSDYGLHEYTCFVRRAPRAIGAPQGHAWWTR